MVPKLERQAIPLSPSQAPENCTTTVARPGRPRNWVGEGCIMTGSGQALRLAGFVVGCSRTKQSERNMFYHQGDDFSRTGDGEGKTSEDKSDDKSGKKS